MTAENRCKRSLKSCSYCTTGVFKRTARRLARHIGKRELKNY